MKCKRLSLVLLSLVLVSSPAFCGWGFLNGSETKSSTSEQLVTPVTEKTNEQPKEEKLAQVEAPQTTTISEEEKTNFLNSINNNESGIQKLSQTYKELENSSILSQNKNLENFKNDLLKLQFNLTDSNLNSERAESLLNSYDEELQAVNEELAAKEAEANRLHIGIGASYVFDNDVFNGNFDNTGVSLDTYARKNNTYVSGSVTYPVKEFMDFSTDKLSYKVGIGYEF